MNQRFMQTIVSLGLETLCRAPYIVCIVRTCKNWGYSNANSSGLQYSC